MSESEKKVKVSFMVFDGELAEGLSGEDVSALLSLYKYVREIESSMNEDRVSLVHSMMNDGVGLHVGVNVVTTLEGEGFDVPVAYVKDVVWLALAKTISTTEVEDLVGFRELLETDLDGLAPSDIKNRVGLAYAVLSENVYRIFMGVLVDILGQEASLSGKDLN